MAQKGSDTKPLKGSQKSSFASKFAYWTAIFGVNLYDLLGLCHLVPVPTCHINRPFMISGAQFRKTPRKKIAT